MNSESCSSNMRDGKVKQGVAGKVESKVFTVKSTQESRTRGVEGVFQADVKRST